MRPKERRESGQKDLFKARLDQIVDLDHALVKLAGAVDWRFLEDRFGAVYDDDPGRPPLPTRLMAGLAILKHMHDLSDEVLCERWVENPYYQLLCGGRVFPAPAGVRSVITDALAAAHGRREGSCAGSGKPRIRHPHGCSQAGRLHPGHCGYHRAGESDQLPDRCQADASGPRAAGAPGAGERHQAPPVLCAGWQVRPDQAPTLRPCETVQAREQGFAPDRTLLGRVIRDIRRKIVDNPSLGDAFALPLSLAHQVRDQRQRQRGKKIYSLHAPEVECIGKEKAHKPYEFGVKVSVATPINRCKGGQFVLHAKALPGNPYDGHTLAVVIPKIEASVGASLAKIVADAGYRGHNASKEKAFKVYVVGQKRGLSSTIKRAFRRRSAVEPVIGHLKNEHRMGRNHLAGSRGDAANAVLAAAGYNFRLLFLWISILCAWLSATIYRNLQP